MANKMAIEALVKGGEGWGRYHEGNDLDFTGEPIPFNLNGRIFEKLANFDRATFEVVEMSGSHFKEGATFRNARFQKVSWITPSDSHQVLDFSEAEFFDDVHMKVPNTHLRMVFDRAKFHKRLFITFGPNHGDLDFSSAKFYGDVIVRVKTGAISFKGAKFGVDKPVKADFNSAELEGYANFDSAYFSGPAIFENTKFKAITSFLGTTFCVAPSFHGATLHQGTKFSHASQFPSFFLDTTGSDAANAYRTLKLAMNAQHAHSEELGFFLLEMRSTVPHQAWWAKPFYWLYDWVSRYGISVWRPAALLIGINIGVGLLFSCLTRRPWGWWAWDPEVIALTLYGAIPFAPALRSQVPEMSALFPLGVPAIVPVIVAAQGLLNAALLFLVLLGIRNTFRIK